MSSARYKEVFLFFSAKMAETYVTHFLTPYLAVKGTVSRDFLPYLGQTTLVGPHLMAAYLFYENFVTKLYVDIFYYDPKVQCHKIMCI